MKINTDGVLLAALLVSETPKRIIDIGTGTGVIALMLAQRFENAALTGIELDEKAVKTAKKNFSESSFLSRVEAYSGPFQSYFVAEQEPVDLIVSNPPFFIDALKSPNKQKEIAKHADMSFFDDLLLAAKTFLKQSGELWLILPPDTAQKVLIAAEKFDFHLHLMIRLKSFESSQEHRHIISLSKQKRQVHETQFVIYSGPGQYSAQYREALKDFFINF
ncbi:methyltransferase [Pedobacter sp. HMF7647]|uniref:Methyltransferase n=2 Tax=Hufsiella arboris TaxID=2695275 RepID=A0A7K1Y9E9_9SPHI|nr:methyltransferase [Hufsiella arboris]MXV51214.1 methyltransferase [Hufsiella arboris]